MKIVIKAEINNNQLMQGLRDLTINNENFRHQEWSIWDAEVLEYAAKMIREGYTNKTSEI